LVARCHGSRTRPVDQESGARRGPPGSTSRRCVMKVVVIGGTGLNGSQVVSRVREQGHEAVPASPHTGVNTLTGEGLAEPLAGADVVVDVSNSDRKSVVQGKRGDRRGRRVSNTEAGGTEKTVVE